jgi:hypothetical protein
VKPSRVIASLRVVQLHHRAAREVHAEVQPARGERAHRDQERDHGDHVEDQRVAHEPDVALDPEEFHVVMPLLN